MREPTLPTYGNPPQPLYELCRSCDHFIEDNDAIPTLAQLEGDGLARYIHLDNGDKEHDHDAMPTGGTLAEEWFAGVAMWMTDWRSRRPDLFIGHPDGQIGPNSRFHVPLVRHAD